VPGTPFDRPSHTQQTEKGPRTFGVCLYFHVLKKKKKSFLVTMMITTGYQFKKKNGRHRKNKKGTKGAYSVFFLSSKLNKQIS
jgi:hypothetical protein